MSNSIWRLSVAALALSALSGGAGCRASGTRPDDMSAAGHEHAAQEHEQESEEHAASYDPRATRAGVVGGVAARAAASVDADLAERNPTERHRVAAARHLALADEHRAAAEALQRFEADQCVSIAPKERADCPLLVAVASAEAVAGGVRLHLATGVDPRELLAHARCHFAFGRTLGREGMPHCPLYLRDVGVTLVDEGTIELSTPHAEDVELLRRRAADHASP